MVSPTPVTVPALPTPMVMASTRLAPSRAMVCTMAGPVTRRWILRVVVVGQPVHIVPAVCGGGLRRQRPGPGQTAAGGAVPDLCAQPQQVLLPQGRGVLRHHQHHRVPGGQAGQREGGGKGAGGRFNDGLPGSSFFFSMARASIPSARPSRAVPVGPLKSRYAYSRPFSPQAAA